MTSHSSVLAHVVSRVALSASLLVGSACHAQLSVEEVVSGGVLNPTDTSWHYYLDQMKRFPDRLGFICVNGYELDKIGEHVGGLAFLSECSQRGNAPSMVYLAHMLEAGRGSDSGADPEAAARWLRRAAEADYAVAQFHLGVALLLGRGVEADSAEAKYWLRRSAAQGDVDAQALVRADFDERLAANARPLYD